MLKETVARLILFLNEPVYKLGALISRPPWRSCLP